MIEIKCAFDTMVNVRKLKPHPKNRNKHPKDQIERLAEIVEYQGWRKPITVSNRSGFITAGHGRLAVAKFLKMKEVPVDYQEYDSEEQEYADVQADNAIALWSDLDLSAINQDIPELGPDFNIDMLGLKDFTLDPSEKEPPDMSGNLSAKFMIPPFSVLDTRQGYWQDRKREWLSLGIKSELGRGGGIDGQLQKPGTLGSIPPNQKDIMGRKGKYKT